MSRVILHSVKWLDTFDKCCKQVPSLEMEKTQKVV